MQQIYRRTPIPKCDFNKVAKQLYWNRTSAWVLCCKFAAYFQNIFFSGTPLDGCFCVSHLHCRANSIGESVERLKKQSRGGCPPLPLPLSALHYQITISIRFYGLQWQICIVRLILIMFVCLLRFFLLISFLFSL